MAYNPVQIKAIGTKLASLGKEKALEYIRKNAATIAKDPNLAKTMSSVYTETFTGIPTPAKNLGTPVKPALNASTVAQTLGTPAKPVLGAATVVKNTDTPDTSWMDGTKKVQTEPKIVTEIQNKTPDISGLTFDHSSTITSVPG